MQLSEFDFACEWCGTEFVRPHQRGRRPLYCTRTCRQRAYEDRRRGACVLGLPKPTVADRLHPTPARYQAGVGGPYLNKVHALRPDGAADCIGFRPTLCGASVKPSPQPFYEHDTRKHNCLTCRRMAERFTPARRIEPLSDIGTAMALFGRLRSARHAPEEELRRLVDQVLASFGILAGAEREEREVRVAQMTSH
jgi:hypothetical protein